jgi:hypothetical protein
MMKAKKATSAVFYIVYLLVDVYRGQKKGQLAKPFNGLKVVYLVIGVRRI